MSNLQLRLTEETDLDYVLDAENDGENRQYIIPWSREQHLQAIRDNNIAHLIVWSETRVGYVILAGLLDTNQSVEFRRIVITDKGKGYGKQTVEIVKKLAFETYNDHRLWLDVKAQNHRAQAIYKAAGFAIEGTLRECLKSDNGYESLVIMSILQREYRNLSPIVIRQATLEDLSTVLDILLEAILWLEQKDMAFLNKDEISLDLIRPDVEAGLFYIAFYEGVAAGVLRFQTEDLVFWDDIPQEYSAFIQRLAVRRSFAGGKVSSALMQWAVEKSRELGKSYLRLDCAADRSRLRAVYENFGFQYHSDKLVEPYFVARYEYKL
ncbi:GNAT family N-acetyltransferase [Pseudanabaena sp. UWO310]|uniref:GNAT family N-acetyltransferase n=1 Tax=Pseudanabaena sp. UWO310 TaxID=2480795 RepID=UPI001CC1CF0A|nr:GNAT family N-acetyltransferase [Pseudanabaena sp. UWO310]